MGGTGKAAAAARLPRQATPPPQDGLARYYLPGALSVVGNTFGRGPRCCSESSTARRRDLFSGIFAPHRYRETEVIRR